MLYKKAEHPIPNTVAKRVLHIEYNSKRCGVYIKINIISTANIVKVHATVLSGAPYIPKSEPTKKYSIIY